MNSKFIDFGLNNIYGQKPIIINVVLIAPDVIEINNSSGQATQS